MIFNNQLDASLKIIGTSEKHRTLFTELLIDFEKTFKDPNCNVREEITGPLIDALYKNDTIIRKKLKNGLLINFVHRSKITRDFILSHSLLPDHIWEPQTTRLLLHFSGKAKNVLIGGAYIGDHALFIAKNLLKNGGICYAFEPDKTSYSMLIRNARTNKLKSLIAINRPLSNRKDLLLKMIDEDAYSHAASVAEAFPSSNFSTKDIHTTITIDDYVGENNLHSLDLIMLDIEGGEFDALRGAKKTIGTYSPVIVFEIHRKYVDWLGGLDKTDIMRYLYSFGYHLYAIRDFHSNVDMHAMPIELIPCTEVYLEGPPHGFNMLAIKDDSLLRNKIFKIVKNVSPKLLFHKNAKLHLPLDWNNDFGF